MLKSALFALTITAVLTGCAGLPNNAPGGSVGVDGVACVGTPQVPAQGVQASDNPALLAMARLPSDKGGVCEAKVLAVTAPVVLYRVFDADKPYTQWGGWWSLQPPAGTKEQYRADNAICPEWSPLNKVVSCQVRPGSQLVIGTTQSAQCADGSIYPKTAQTQVFVPNDSRAGIVHVGACSALNDWP